MGAARASGARARTAPRRSGAATGAAVVGTCVGPTGVGARVGEGVCLLRCCCCRRQNLSRLLPFLAVVLLQRWMHSSAVNLISGVEQLFLSIDGHRGLPRLHLYGLRTLPLPRAGPVHFSSPHQILGSYCLNAAAAAPISVSCCRTRASPARSLAPTLRGLQVPQHDVQRLGQTKWG